MPNCCLPFLVLRNWMIKKLGNEYKENDNFISTYFPLDLYTSSFFVCKTSISGTIQRKSNEPLKRVFSLIAAKVWDTHKTIRTEEERIKIKFWLPYIEISNLNVIIPEAPAGSPPFVDALHGISVELTIALVNNTLDARTIVLEIKAD